MSYLGPVSVSSVVSAEPGNRQPEILVVVDRLEKAVASLHSAAENLGARLSSVLSPSEPQPAPDDRRGLSAGSSDLGRVLSDRCVAIEHVTCLLSSLNRRCEL
jgi:hypothetical protein